MLLRRRAPWQPLTARVATGAAMSLVVDETQTPRLGFSAPNRAYPLVTHVRGLVAHVAFGVTVATVVEESWRVLEAGSGGPCAR